MPRGVNQIQFVVFATVLDSHRHSTRFDRDSTLSLELHVVEQLFLHFTFLDNASVFEQSVGERTFAVIDVRDDAEVADILRVNFGHVGYV